MEFNWSLIVSLVLLIALVYVATLWVRAWRDRKPSQQITIHSSIEDMRSIGELAVYKVFTKEIVTETDHSWGQFGERYLSWVLTQKKWQWCSNSRSSFATTCATTHSKSSHAAQARITSRCRLASTRYSSATSLCMTSKRHGCCRGCCRTC